jgi:hypothetical protein
VGAVIAQAIEAETAILDAEHGTAADRLVAIADTMFAVEVFASETALDWHDVLRHWFAVWPSATSPSTASP